MNMLRMVGVVFLAGFLLAALVFFGLYHWASKDLPGFKKITDYRPPLVTTVLTGDNQVLGYFFRERRFLVRLDEMSPYLPKAFLAAEDSGFYQHEGVDLTAIFRAALVNLRSGSIRQGGSTITQQIIKRLLLSSEKSYQRKLKEAILAYRLENYLTKEEILTIYLNQIYLGAGAYGVEAAARSYFGKHVADLNLAECALLAGLPQAPSHYNPYQHPRAAKARQKYVLEQMLGIGWISREEYEAALARDIELTSMDDPSWSIGPYYLEEVRRWLIARYGEDEVYEGGLTVYTPCDLFHQAAAEKALRNGLAASAKRRGWIGPLGRLEPGQAQEFLRAEADLDRTYAKGDWVKVLVAAVDAAGAEVRFGSERGLIPVSSMDWCRTPDPKKAPEDVPKIKDARKVLAVGDLVWASVESAPGKAGGPWRLNLEREPEIEGAVVSLDPRTGDVLALSGGFSFERSQFNRATQARRQPGSAFKPIVYSAAIDEGFTAASLVLDAPIVFENQEQGKLWRPENYEGVFYGPTMLRTALAKSRNLVTLRVAQKVGVGKIIKRAKDLGLEADFPYDLSVALGSAAVSPINLCRAFSAFARGGSIVQPRMVLKVDSAWGEEMYKAEVASTEAISPQTAYIIASLLKEVVQDGTGWRARALGRPVAAKTGTTNNEQDAWFMGFTPYLLTGVYVGFDQLRPMGRLETGARAASPIWVEYRTAVESRYPAQDFPQPAGVVMVRVDASSGLLAGPQSEEVFFLPFKAGTEPSEVAKVDAGGKGVSSDDDLLKQVF